MARKRRYDQEPSMSKQPHLDVSVYAIVLQPSTSRCRYDEIHGEGRLEPRPPLPHRDEEKMTLMRCYPGDPGGHSFGKKGLQKQ